MLAFSCGAPPESPAPGSKTESAALRITSAQWRGGQEPRIRVSGDWGIGASTPPVCSITEGGETSDSYEPATGTRLDGGRFSREFAPAPDADRAVGSAREIEYHARCRVSQSTGRTVDATAPVRGSPPSP